MTTNLAYAYAADITKTERDPDTGELYVYGKATGSDRDLDGQRCDPEWLKSAMPDWFEWANVREMHRPVAAGVGVELLEEGDDWYVKSLVVDPGTANRIEKKVLKGYSIGIKDPHINIRDGQEWIVGGNICEISYVDRPCNPTAKLAICKMAGGQASDWEPAEVDPGVDEVTISVGAAKFTPADLAKLVARKNTATLAEPDLTSPAAADVEVVAEQPVVVDQAEVEPVDALVVEETAVAPVAIDAPTTSDGAPGETPPAAGAPADDTITINGTVVDSKQFLDALTAALRGSGVSDADKAAAAKTELLIKHYGLTVEQLDELPDSVQDLLAAKAAALRSTPDAKPVTDKGAMPPLKPGGKPRYPIDSVQDFKDAILAYGRGKDADKDKIQAHIKSEAKRLGQSALIPEDWKSVLADLAKADGEDDGDRDGGKVEADGDGAGLTHDPAELAAIRDSLVAVIKAELDELCAGQPELCDVDQLLCSLSMFLRWWQSEARGGETDSPYKDPDEGGVDVVEVYLAAAPDTTKTESPVDSKTPVPASGADDERRLTELVKSAVAQATAASEERIKALEIDLQKALALPEPGGPVITRTSAQAAVAKATDAEQLKREADGLIAKALDVEPYSPKLANGYRTRAAQLLKTAAA